MVDIANLFHPLTFARPVRTLAETTVAEGRRLQTLVTTWDDEGRLVRREMFDGEGNSRVVTVRRYDEPGYVETERTENARGELLGHRRVTQGSGGELVSEAWHAHPLNVFQIDGMQFSVRDAARSVYRFAQDERFIGAQLMGGDAIVAVVSVSYDERGRRTRVVCDAPPLGGEIRYRHEADALTAELFLRGERVLSKHVTFDAKGRVQITTTSDAMGHSTHTRFDYAENAAGDWIRLDVVDLTSGRRGSSVEREIVYR